MYPFWDLAIQPVLRAVEAKRIVEIGALRGETTAYMLSQLGPDAELHVIDPVPAFDPSEHELEFPGRYIFHRDVSHNALPTIPPVDVALVDGDHNWYTVYHELRQLAAVCDEAGAPLPVFILHDVCWPYGRRDLYYSPDQIPEEFRQPYAQRGMMPGASTLLKSGGLNPTMYNALEEGGPRNGVMTGLDDFVAERPEDLRVLVLPVYFGLAIVADAARLERQPALAELLDWFEGQEGQKALALLTEENRLQGLLVQHGVFFNADKRTDKAAKRYLDLLKASLLNEHYLENELRIDHLVNKISNGYTLHSENMRDPSRQMKDFMQRLQSMRRAGKLRDPEDEVHHYFPYTNMGRARLAALQACMDTVRTENVQGDIVEVGTGRGGGGIFLRGYLDAYEMLESTVWIADEFRASPPGQTTGAWDQETDVIPGGGPGFPDLWPDLNNVRDGFKRYDLLDKRVRFAQGPVAQSLATEPIGKVSLIRIGEGITDDARVALDLLYPKLAVGGFVVIDRYNAPRVQKAVDAFRSEHGIEEQLERVDWAGATWRKTTGAAEVIQPRIDPVTRTAGAPLAPNPPWIPCALTVVVVFYNMKREAARTLHSLSRAYQQGIDDLDYEVIVVENGSRPDQVLGKDYVKSFGPQFRYINMGSDAPPSPIPALNRGISEARGEHIALMIDGAHVLTPGVLRFGMSGLTTYGNAIVSTQQWYVGPGQQNETMVDGYDQASEDILFENIEWPVDGYQLFNIGHFIGERDWFDGMWESNCLFAPRQLLQQVGGFDESFAMPGGGFANLELYERLGSDPNVTFVTMLGEGSFHQVHGGTTTNVDDIAERHERLRSYSEHFQDIRGRAYRGHLKKIYYVGSMTQDAARTRARRRTAWAFFRQGNAYSTDGPPPKPAPIPDELRDEMISAYFHSLRWRKTSWMGQTLPKLPTDLFALAEILYKVRPKFVVETGTGNGGQAFFLATVLDLIGEGTVVTISSKTHANRPEHPRITYLEGVPQDDATVAQVRAIVGDEPNAVVILGQRHSPSKTMAEFRGYGPMVPKGSYLIVEDTLVNGHPVWTDFGAGPWEAVKGIVESRGDWASDLAMEKYALTFNPKGFLKRLR